MVAGDTVIALAAAERPSFLAPPTLHGDAPWLAGPLAGHWPALTDAVGSLRWDVTLVLLGDDGVLAARDGVRAARRPGGGARGGGDRRVVLTLAPPFSLTDTFNYLHYGRMLPLYGLDPYTALPIQAGTDPAYRYSTWHHLPSPYGPLFTLLTELLAPLSLPVAYWVLKASVGLAALAVAVLVALLARRLGRDPARAVAFVSLNPLVLVYGVGGVHNDVFFMALLLGGALLVLRAPRAARRERLGGGRGGQALGRARDPDPDRRRRAARARGGGRRGSGRGGAGRDWLGVPRAPARRRDAGAAGRGPEPAEPRGLALGHGGLDAQLRGELEVARRAGHGRAHGVDVADAALGDGGGVDAGAARRLARLGDALVRALDAAVRRARPARRAPRGGDRPDRLPAGGWAPATAPLLHRLGAHPTRTATGRANSRFMQRLLR